MSRLASFIITVVSSLAFVACGGGGSSSHGSAAPEPADMQRPSNTQCTAFAVRSAIATPYFDIRFDSAITSLVQAPGESEYWYATTQNGVLARIDNTAGASSYIAIEGVPAVHTSIEAGLLSVAFHPRFADNRHVYLSYVSGADPQALQSHVTRYTLNGSALTEPLDILVLDRGDSTHNGGNIAFGPDGYLYVAFGDGGGGGDPFGNGQNRQTLFAKMLRIDVDGGVPYAVPQDNPFIADNAFLPEIFAMGFRNPWRWSFDRLTGELWVADVGQFAWEEVNRVRGGENFGWPVTEGNHCYATQQCSFDGLTAPVFEYSHDEGCAVTGGFVYRGTAIPQLYGHYVYGDYCNATVKAFAIDDATATAREIIRLPAGGISTFGEGLDGEILIGTATGTIHRLAASDANPSIPQTLSQHPCFADAASQQLVDGVIPYSVNSQLWSDGLNKTRFIALPDGATIDTDSDGDMLFPTGSVLIKQFHDDKQLIETRFLMHHAEGWAGYSYKWNDEGSDATLVQSVDIKVLPGGRIHTFPSSAQCFQCHTDAAHITLGPEIAQLGMPSGNDSVLQNWQRMGLFTSDITAADNKRYIPAPDDTAASVEQRARAYLHSNCSGCHRAGGFPDHFDLRHHTALADTGICNTVPSAGDLGIDGARLLVPGDSARSLIYQRMNRRGEHQMPPLASNAVDEQAVQLIAQWIDGINACP